MLSSKLAELDLKLSADSQSMFLEIQASIQNYS